MEIFFHLSLRFLESAASTALGRQNTFFFFFFYRSTDKKQSDNKRNSNTSYHQGKVAYHNNKGVYLLWSRRSTLDCSTDGKSESCNRCRTYCIQGKDRSTHTGKLCAARHMLHRMPSPC